MSESVFFNLWWVSQLVVHVEDGMWDFYPEIDIYNTIKKCIDN